MNCFVDTSVVLRFLLGEPQPLAQWQDIGRAFASALMPVEMGRVIDRYRLQGKLTDEQVAALHQRTAAAVGACDVVAVSPSILRRAAQAMPTIVGTLDAIHLATALAVARTLDGHLTLATHDRQLACAARACGLVAIGDAA